MKMKILDHPRLHTLRAQDVLDHSAWFLCDDGDVYRPVVFGEDGESEHGVLILRAKFSINGSEYLGTLAGYPSAYACGVFVGEDEFHFNVNMRDVSRDAEVRLSRRVGSRSDALFPISYSVDAKDIGLAASCGEFNIGPVRQ